MMEITICKAGIGRGTAWITGAWSYFSNNPLGWIAALIVLFLISAVLSLVPFGSLVLNVFYPVILGGYMLGCKAHHEGSRFEFQHIFSGFKEPYFTPLILIGAIYTIASVIIILLLIIITFILLGGFELLMQLEQGDIGDVSQFQQKFILLTLIGVLLFTPFIMAMWFAPVIVIHTQESAGSAMIKSFKACLVNIMPLTLYGIVIFILAIVAAIPLMLGYFILLPVITASIYVSFLDCFKLDDTNEPTQLLP